MANKNFEEILIHPSWIVDINYNITFVVGFIGNLLVIIISLKIKIQEIRACKWIICIQAAIESIACIMNILFKFVSFFYNNK